MCVGVRVCEGVMRVVMYGNNSLVFSDTACSCLLYYKQWEAGRGLGLRSQWHSFIPDGKVCMTNRICSTSGAGMYVVGVVVWECR